MTTIKLWWLAGALVAAILEHIWPIGLIGPIAQAASAGQELKARPVTTASGKVGDLLRQWWKEGTAAGNVGDWYDNRDGAHSDLDTKPHPQLQRVIYSDEDIKQRKHWAAQRVFLPFVVFGNSSTSAPPTLGGSNPRMYYTGAAGLNFLHEQYRNSNLYIYPEHRDHDPGHNGRGDGYGDLYATNTPYLIISQGSSGSDQPFMRALPFTLAAFRPEVKTKLKEQRMLMPTLQWLLRTTNKNLKDPMEYLTGKAHPTVFEGAWVDDLALVQKAHSLTIDALPPLVQLKVLEEDRPRPGVDYFDPAESEKLADTPGVIARIWRGKNFSRRLLVSAADSLDVNQHALKFTWVVLRGDQDKIRITPRGKANCEAEIVVDYHPRRPIAPGAAMESNRVDIGVFAHNGTHYSPPAFITFYSLDNESRAYDAKGRLLEVGYGHGSSVLAVTDWKRLLDLLGADTPAAKLMRISKEERAVLVTAAAEHAKRTASVARLQVDAKQDDKKKAAEAEQARQKAAQAVRDLFEKEIVLDKTPLLTAIENRWRALARDPKLTGAFTDYDAKNPTIMAARKRLVGLGLADERDGTVLPKSRLGGAWTDYELSHLEHFHAILLTQRVFVGAVSVRFEANFVDLRLTPPKDWRDVFRYDAQGRLLGWTRYDGEKATEFSTEGVIVLEKDALGRCTKGRTVTYRQEPSKGKGLNTNPLRFLPGDTLVSFAYADDQDFRGRVTGKEPIAK